MRTYGRLSRHSSSAVDTAPSRTRLSAADRWRLDADPNVVMRVKRIFPRVASERDRALYIGDTPEVAFELLWLTKRWPLEMAASAAAYLEARASEYVEARDSVDRVLAGERLTGDGWLEPARAPRDYQVLAADAVLSVGRLLVVDELGLGKTFTGLLVLRSPAALPAVVVCPTHLQRQWMRELALSFPMLRGHIVTRTAPYDPAEVYARELGGRNPDVLVVPYSKIAGWGHHLAGAARTVIFDEIQELRRPQTQKYIGSAMVADAADYRMGLTATPVYNYGGEIHSIFSILDKDALGTREEFIAEWGRNDNGRVYVSNPRALGAHMRQERLMIRRTRADVRRELPEVLRIPHTVAADEHVIDQQTAGTTLALAELILSGGGTREERFVASGDLDAQLRRATGLAKAPYVADFVRLLIESDEKVVLFGWHRDVYDVWRERLADLAPIFYTGSESQARKEAAREAFISDPERRLLVMSLRSGAGLDGLQEVSKVAVFGELDWSPAQHDQCIGRLHRDGQDGNVLAYFLTCNHGSDPVVMETLGIKRGQAEPIRDPDAALFEQAAPDARDRIRRLAEHVRDRHRDRGKTVTITVGRRDEVVPR